MRYFLLALILLMGCSRSAGDQVEEIPRMASESAAEAKTGVFLYVYTADWCRYCRSDKPLWTRWATDKGLKINPNSTPDGNYQVHVVDTDKVRSTRRINSLPTYLILSAAGDELWRHEGAIDIAELDRQWKAMTP